MKLASLRSWFTWWFVLVFPMYPMEIYVHMMALITIANVLLMCRGFPPAIPYPMTDYTIARIVLMIVCSCLGRWCPCSEMMTCFTRLQILWVKHIGGGQLWHVWSASLCEHLPRCIRCYISGSDLDDDSLFVKRVLISILTGSHY